MSQTTNAAAGRPRDPMLEQRVRDAAVQLYGRVGWAGFSIDAVAREAHVGKSSIYLRWSDNTALLLDTLQERIDVPYGVDTGSVRGDLLTIARRIFELLTGDAGDALLRLSAEGRLVPELAPRWEDFLTGNVTAMRNITRRAIARNDLPADTPTTLFLDALFGGLLMQCLASPPSRMAKLVEESDSYTEGLVDLVLAAVTRPQ